ncbi:MAG: hypothetical protein WCF57_24345 [Pyrinomonadaceae bacterium]
MSINAKTDVSPCTFTVKEFGDGTPWIMVELYKPGIPALENGHIGLRFRPGIMMTQAEEMARTLSDSFESISHTYFK